MNARQITIAAARAVRTGLVSAAIFQLAVGNAFAAEKPQSESRDSETATPIKHVIVIIGENRSFDHVFATYVPKKGQKVWNLLSEGIVNADGTPGPNFDKAQQMAAQDEASDGFVLAPTKGDFPGNLLPAPLVGGPKDSYIPNDSLTTAVQSENGLPADYYGYLVTGGSGQTSRTPDQRIKNVSSLPAGPFQLTNGDTFTYNSYAASPVHRFYQMWQQLNCSIAHASVDNPSGCTSRLFPWVETTVGAGTNGIKQPANFKTEYSPTATTTGEGSTAMGFYNVQNGDAPYFKSLADTYAMSDNFHQSVNGGTGANHIMLGHADMIYYSDGNGNAAVPPHNTVVAAGSSNQHLVLDDQRSAGCSVVFIASRVCDVPDLPARARVQTQQVSVVRLHIHARSEQRNAAVDVAGRIVDQPFRNRARMMPQRLAGRCIQCPRIVRPCHEHHSSHHHWRHSRTMPLPPV